MIRIMLIINKLDINALLFQFLFRFILVKVGTVYNTL